MAYKTLVNNTGYQLNGNLIVRNGAQPGSNLTSMQFVLSSAMGSSQTISYGDSSNIYVNELEVSGLINGGYIVSNQIVVTRGSELDDLFNTRDTIRIGLVSQSLVITSSNG